MIGTRTRWLRDLRFSRSGEDVVLAGVAGGLGDRWGVDPMLVRVAFVVLSFAGALGVFAYLAAWLVALDPGDPDAPEVRSPTLQQGMAFGLIVLGVVLVLRATGFWFGDAVGVPLLVAAVGAAVIYVRTPAERRSRLPLELERPSPARIAVGALLVLGGLGAFVGTGDSLASIGRTVAAVGITAAGLGLVLGPWVWRLWRQLAAERYERVRSEERAEVAAHLHDSVLQTLALIQRHAEDPRRTVSLARRQERALRSWLYGGSERPEGSLRAALEAAAAEAEDAHDVPVQVVVVGDCELDERTQAVVHACREAVTNAARHSGAAEVDVYVECESGGVTAFVRDRGRGFDPAAVPADRRGIADSIRGRVQRHGGTARISSRPGEGTEVEIRLPEAKG